MKCPILVSRDRELAALRDAVNQAGDGVGSMVVISGEPGVGKSRSVSWLVEEAQRQGLVVLSGRAVRASTPTPLRPLSEALLSWLRRNELPDSDQLNHFRPSLARLAPQLGTDVAGEQATSLVLLGEALLRLASAVGDQAGCLLVVEDLHWADPETLEVLEYVADNIAEVPLLVTATMRPNEAAAVQELADVLAARGAASVLALSALGPDDTGAMVRACLGSGVPVEVEEFVLANAGGLPLLVEELLTGMEAAGTLVRSADGWHVTAQIGRTVPQTFARTVLQRLDSLPDHAQRVARAASLLGTEFDWPAIGRALPDPDAAVLDALRRLVDHQLVVPVDQAFAFRHALTREAVLDTMLPPEKAALAARLAAALDEAPREDAEADHQAVAELLELAGEPDRAAASWAAGADQARARGALATALVMLSRAGGLVASDSDLGLTIREVLLEVHALSGDSPRAMAVGTALVAELESRSADRSRVANVRLRLARAAHAGGLWAEAVEFLDATGDVDPPVTEVLRARVALGQLRPDEAVAHARRALALTGTDRPEVSCEAWEVLGKAARGQDVLEAEESFEQAYRIADDHDLGHLRSRVLAELGALDLVGRRPVEDRLLSARGAALASGAVATAAGIELNLNLLRIRYLDLEEAMVSADAGIALMTRLRLPDLGNAYLIRAFTHGLAGRPDEMESDIAAGLAVAGGDPLAVAAERAHVRGPVALSLGRYDEAREEFAKGIEGFRQYPGFPFSMRGLWALLETVLADGAEAREEVRHGPQVTSPHNWFALRYADAVALGRQGRADEAAQVFADAEWTHPGREPWMEIHMRGLVARGAAADGWGEPAAWYRRTLDSLVEVGQVEAASACRAAMRDAGIPVPRKVAGSQRVPANLQQLGVTAREFEVLELASEGLSNQAIADRLFLSSRTVETHVARLLQRTGCSSRTELGGFLPR